MTFLEEYSSYPLNNNTFTPSINKNKIILNINSDLNAKKILYWSSNLQNSDNISDFNNSGITDVINSIATINLNCNYPIDNKYIHYRVINNEGILSEIYVYDKEMICKND